MTTHSAALPDTRALLIGAGAIAPSYIGALQSLGCRQIGLLSRRLEPAQKLASEHGITHVYGGGESALPDLLSKYDAFIVATPVPVIKSYAELFAKAGAQRVLLEKPAFLFSDDLKKFTNAYPKWDAALALNRLDYPSVAKMREIIASEGISSVEFSFTEWVHRIDPAIYDKVTLARWGLANCIHVVSTVFDLIGLPKDWHVTQQGKSGTPWHPTGSIFQGQGISDRGVPFVYHADWNTAGRWSITIRTARGAYTLCPMEGITFTPKGSVQVETLLAPWDGATKCGFAPMLKNWLEGKPTFRLSQLAPHMHAIEKMFGYEPTA